MTSTRTSRIIKARPERAYAAFMDPTALAKWLPPGEMTGKVHAFDARAQGGYEMSLFYPESERKFRGKTLDREDRITVRFEELVPARKIIEAVTFHSVDPAFSGEMRIEITFDAVASGTEVTFTCTNLPPGLRPEDNEAGTRLSLEQLARYVEEQQD